MDKQGEALKLLKEIKDINGMIQRLQEQIDAIYTILTSTTVKPKEVDVQSSGSNDPMADRMIKILEYQDEVQEYQLQLIEKKKIALKTMMKLEIEEQHIITLKYFDNYTIEEIGAAIGYEYRWTWQKIHDAEQNFATVYEKTT